MWWRLRSGFSRRRSASVRARRAARGSECSSSIQSCAGSAAWFPSEPAVDVSGGSATEMVEPSGEESGLSFEAGEGGVVPDDMMGLVDFRPETELG